MEETTRVIRWIRIYLAVDVLLLTALLMFFARRQSGLIFIWLAIWVAAVGGPSGVGYYVLKQLKKGELSPSVAFRLVAMPIGTALMTVLGFLLLIMGMRLH